jgi:tetratricopeptide (TPR) repeat protein
MTDPADREAQSWNVVQIGNEYWKHGKYENAERSYDEALQNFPGYYLALAGKGRTLASKGDLYQAAELLQHAQSKHLNLENILLLGDVYAALGATEKADAQYELAQSGELGLGSADDPHRVALFWADIGVNLESAVAIAADDYSKQKDIYSSDTLAWCLFRAGRAEEAQPYAAEAMRIGTPDAKILFHAGMIAKGVGNNKEAARLLKRALDLNPKFDLRWASTARETLAATGA